MSDILPLEVIDQSINQKVHVILSSAKEFKGTLVGYDDFVNIILADVSEIEQQGAETVVIAERKQLLLSGGSIAMIIPGGL